MTLFLWARRLFPARRARDLARYWDRSSNATGRDGGWRQRDAHGGSERNSRDYKHGDVSANDAAGNPLTDPSPVNNTATSTRRLPPPPTTTDLQVTGSPLNGGPTAARRPLTPSPGKSRMRRMLRRTLWCLRLTLPAGLPFRFAYPRSSRCMHHAAGGKRRNHHLQCGHDGRRANHDRDSKLQRAGRWIIQFNWSRVVQRQ